MRRALLRTHVRRQFNRAPAATALIQNRTVFGIGEIIGVLTNPGEMLRSLAESKKLLEEARQEMKDNSERQQIPPIHAFSPLPGFWDRPSEMQALERALGGVPAFTVVFGASSVGKTALLRQVLSSDKYRWFPEHSRHETPYQLQVVVLDVLHFDLRIAGFADLASLYFSLSRQMESYFAVLPELMGTEWGWGEFEKESWAFKHDRIAIEKRIEAGGTGVKPSDVARLMELFQSALLKYWDHEPMSESARKELAEAKARQDDTKGEKATEPVSLSIPRSTAHDPTEGTMREGWGAPAVDLHTARTVKDAAQDKQVTEDGASDEGVEEERKPPPKRIPVFFIDEAHKLPALIQSGEAMKSLLDAMLVLTKQDRLCHCLHATSDPFFMHWLRQLNIMQHCTILSIGDCSRDEAKKYFEEHLVPHLPPNLQPHVSFDGLYEVFGGKLAHLADYCAEFVNSNGEVLPSHSSHFLQAHSLLNLQLIHSMPTPAGHEAEGFEIYSPIKQASPHTAPSPFDGPPSPRSDFSNLDLLHVMKLLAPSSTAGQDAPSEIMYFRLCRELGAKAVDGMVRAKILELRWSRTVTEEGDSSPLRARRKREEIGPVLVPTTAVVRYAMGKVLQEYEEPEAEESTK